MKKIKRILWKVLAGLTILGVALIGMCLPYYKLSSVTNGNMIFATLGSSSDQEFVKTMYMIQNAVSNGAYDREVSYWQARLEENGRK